MRKLAFVLALVTIVSSFGFGDITDSVTSITDSALSTLRSTVDSISN